MQSRLANRQTLFWFSGLLIVSLLCLFVFQKREQELSAGNAPTSFNPRSQGVKALYLLLASQHFELDRLQTSWNGLTPHHGLLILIEPFQRNPGKAEIDQLKRWVESGGTVLYVADAPARPLDRDDPLFGDVVIEEGSAAPIELAPEHIEIPVLQGIQRVHFASPVRLAPVAGSGFQTLFQDNSGILALHKTFGKGNLFLFAGSSLFNNTNLREADNALLVFKLATLGSANNHTILFDEYHHGSGFSVRSTEGSGKLSAAPVSIRLAFWYLVVFLLIILYNGNRRFGSPRPMTRPSFRSSADYLTAMARLLRRSGAADVGVQTHYQHFMRDLTRSLDLPPDERSDRLISKAAERSKTDPTAFRTLLGRCEQVVAGLRVSETEMYQIVSQIEEYRRRMNLVRTNER